MNNDNFTKLKRVFTLLILFAGVSMLTYCTSNSGRMASSFGKRHYTKGHFSDPVGKVNTDYKNYKTPAIASPSAKKEESNNLGTAQPSSTVNNSAAGVQSNSSEKAGQTSQSTGVSGNNSTPVTGDNSASTTDETVSGSNLPVDYTGHGDHMAGPVNNANSLLLAWILCLALSIVCVLIWVAIAASTISGGTGAGIGTGCLLLTLSTMLFIAAIVLFVLWIVAIAR